MMSKGGCTSSPPCVSDGGDDGFLPSIPCPCVHIRSRVHGSLSLFACQVWCFTYWYSFCFVSDTDIHFYFFHMILMACFFFQHFALSATEVGSLISLSPTESCEFFHDPSMKSRLDSFFIMQSYCQLLLSLLLWHLMLTVWKDRWRRR